MYADYFHISPGAGASGSMASFGAPQTRLEVKYDRELRQELIHQAEAAGLRAVFIASGDLSHKLRDNGPYGYAPEGRVFDRRITAAMKSGDFLQFLTMDPADGAQSRRGPQGAAGPPVAGNLCPHRPASEAPAGRPASRADGQDRRGLLLPDLDGMDTVEQQIDIAHPKGGINAREKYTLGAVLGMGALFR